MFSDSKRILQTVLAALLTVGGVIGFIEALRANTVVGALAIIAGFAIAFAIVAVFELQKAKAALEPSGSRKGLPVWPYVAAISILLCGLATAFIYPKFARHDFGIVFPFMYWSAGDYNRSAEFFGYVPLRKVLTEVNASMYVKVTNQTDHQIWIDRAEADALVRGKWIKLLLMGGQASSMRFFQTDSKFAVGWALPDNLNFEIVSADAIQPGNETEGWLFFSYPLSYDVVSKIRLRLTDRAGSSVIATADSPTSDLLRGVHFPPNESAMDFSSLPTIHYADLLETKPQ